MANPCPNCGSDQTKERENVPDSELAEPFHVSTHRCADCSYRFNPSTDGYSRWLAGQTTTEKTDE